MVVEKGEFVKREVLKNAVPDDAVHQYGVELTVGTIYRHSDGTVLTDDDYYREELTEVPTHTRYDYKQRGRDEADGLLREYGIGPRNKEDEFYWLDDDKTYIIEFAQDIDIPDNHIGLLLPRDDLLRVGATLFSGLVEPHEDNDEYLLYVDNDLVLKDGARIGDLIVFETA